MDIVGAELVFQKLHEVVSREVLATTRGFGNEAFVNYYKMFHPGQEKGDSTSLQRECSARARSGKSIHASRPFREMIARPEISRNEWKTAEI